jgi:hypothetical protein
MRTCTSLYDTNTIHHCPEWNTPPETKFTEGDHVFVASREAVGTVSSILPAPPTSAMRCRPHAYYVRWPDGTRSLHSEDALATKD